MRDFENDPKREPMRKPTKPVSQRHDFQRKAENMKNRAHRTQGNSKKKKGLN